MFTYFSCWSNRDEILSERQWLILWPPSWQRQSASTCRFFKLRWNSDRNQKTLNSDGSFCDVQADDQPLPAGHPPHHPHIHPHASPRPPQVWMSPICKGCPDVHSLSLKLEQFHSKLRQSQWQNLKKKKMLQEIEVADKTTSLQYGPPAGRRVADWG